MSNEQKNNDSEYQDVLTSHSYDGIQEFDNPMPFWWKAVFLGTAIWAPIYIFGIEFGYINEYGENLREETVAVSAIRATVQAAAPPVDESVLLAAAGDPTKVEAGQKVFMTTCASCHNQQGQGLIGPNLTDKFWIHGGAPMDIHKVVVEGVAAKGMPPWGNVNSHDDAINVVAFIATLQGTNPANPKEAQGEPYPPEKL